MVKLILEPISYDAQMPTQGTPESACYDVYAALPEDHKVVIEPGQVKMIPTGFKMECPKGYRIAMYPRSGLSVKHSVSLINCVGVIDADYRNEVMVPLMNHGDTSYVVERHDRVAQLAVEFVESLEITQGFVGKPTARKGGFGSTGV